MREKRNKREKVGEGGLISLFSLLPQVLVPTERWAVSVPDSFLLLGGELHGGLRAVLAPLWGAPVSARGRLVAPPPAEPPRLLTIPRVAELLAVKPVTVRTWIGKGRLPRTKIGRCVRVPADAVARFIAENTTPAKSA